MALAYSNPLNTDAINESAAAAVPPTGDSGLTKGALNTYAVNSHQAAQEATALSATAALVAETPSSAALVGEATVYAFSSATASIQGTASLLAKTPASAKVSGEAQIVHTQSKVASADLSSSASVEATSIFVVPGAATASAWAEIVGQFWEGHLIAQAELDATGSIFKVIESTLSSDANMYALGYTSRPFGGGGGIGGGSEGDVVGGGLAGDEGEDGGEDGQGLLIDPSKEPTAQRLIFKIEGTARPLYGSDYSTATIELGDFSVSYDSGKELTFSEYNIDDPGSHTYSNGQSVALELDGVTIFTGKIRSIKRKTNNAESWVEYVAHGVHQLAAEIDVLKQNSSDDWWDEHTIYWLTNDRRKISQFSYQMGGTIIYYEHVKKTVRAAVEEFFDVLGSRFTEFGLSADYDLSGINETVEMTRMLTVKGDLLSALRSVVEMDPGCVPWWDDVEEQWKFVKPLEADAVTVNLNNSVIDSMEWEEPLEGRYTAVRLVADTTITRKRTKTTTELTPFWDGLLEGSWDVVKASLPYAHGSNDDPVFNEYWGVRRQWQVDATLFPSDSDFKLQYKIVQGSQEIWVSVDAEVALPGSIKDAVDASNRFNYGFYSDTQQDFAIVTAAEPIVTKGNPFDPGDCVGVEIEDIRLVWTRDGASELNLSVRYPETGFAGTAYDLYGVEKERVMRLPWDSVTEENARLMHAQLKDVNFSGSINVTGYPLEHLHNLQKRMVFTHPTKQTGMEGHTPVVTQYSYRFGRPLGRSEITLSSDASQLVRSST
jgi:hypothetical protein